MENSNSQPKIGGYRCIIPLVLIAFTITMVTVIVPFKVVQASIIYYPAAAMFIPIFYAIIDVIAEVYGYKMVRFVMWGMAGAIIIFCALIAFVLGLPTAPQSANFQALYSSFFAPLWHIILIGVIGWLIGPFVNGYIISKWKILLKGKYFWLRSIGSSFFGELSQIVFCTLTAFSSFLSMPNIMHVMIFALVYKIIAAIILSWPATILVNWLKKKEGIDVFDINVNYNPLAFKL